MGEKLVVGPINKALRTDRLPFVIDNDSFPTLINAYQWRGRVKRKRGTALLGRLTRFFNSTMSSYNPGVPFSAIITLDSGGNGNILTGYAGFSLQVNGNIVPGTVHIVDSVTVVAYTDPSMDGTLTPSGSINYATGSITILAEANQSVVTQFNYYPDLPVLGIEDFVTNQIQFPSTIAFDTTYAYNIQTAFPYPTYDISFYKNPPTGEFPGYVEKSTFTPTSWNGQTYQQFYTVNYQGAIWVTNGINIPFSTTNIGMHFAPSSSITYVSSTPTTLVLTITNCPLVIGDFVFSNEFTGTNAITLNAQTGYITACSPNIPTLSTKTVTITFPDANIGAGPYIPGIIQYLTTRADTTIDCLRWYDGDPTNGNPTSPTFINGAGWVNFAPPISQFNYIVAESPQAIYYLVGARMIVSYKDRLLFVGPVIQTSAAGSQLYLQDTIIYSQNGTPYYTASFQGDPTLATTVFNPILTPINQTAVASAYFEDQTGFGGFISAGVDQPINTVSPNEDVLICGFNTIQSKVIYTGNDLVPFVFYLINSEMGSSSTFSTVNMDQGVITRGSRGFIITSQNDVRRIDLPIPDQVFEIQLTDNGTERICSQRDYINEWIYFTYTENQDMYKYPNQTLLYNYRDDTWSIFNESYTTYGQFRKQTGFIWSTVGMVYSSWSEWNDPWNAGTNTLEQPIVLGGNQQGFIMQKNVGTSEGTSLYIQNISSGVVTSPDHTLNEGDYILISGCLGTIAPFVNNQIFSVNAPLDENTFTLNPLITSTGTYLGSGLITRYYVPYIQTKQFPQSWGMGRKTRIGVQQYLLTTTSIGQIQLLIFLSQNDSDPYNDGFIVPEVNSENDSLIYSTTLYTCPESTNLGLSPANINLNTVTSSAQNQTWHRMNTSLIGDTVQLGFTMSDDQMRTMTPNGNPISITGATNANPCVLTSIASYPIGTIIKIAGVQGMTQLNNEIYYVLGSSPTTVTIEVDSTFFGMYISGGTTDIVSPIFQTSEIELHSFILDLSPSQLLC